MNRTDRYPDSLKSALQESRFENILDSNMFTAYIPRDTDIPRFADPRSTRAPNVGTYRQPGHVNSTYINQIFSCIGYIKRIQNLDYLKYLPVLYEQLGKFLVVIQDVVYGLNIKLTLEIYEAQKRGFESFFNTYHALRNRDAEWICKIRKHQMSYLEQIDMLMETLKARGSVFDHSGELIYTQILSACRGLRDGGPSGQDAGIDMSCRFVANCCARAALHRQSKVIWSGDMHILKILQHIYAVPELSGTFPQIYLRSSYDPMNFVELFPKWHEPFPDVRQGKAV